MKKRFLKKAFLKSSITGGLLLSVAGATLFPHVSNSDSKTLILNTQSSIQSNIKPVLDDEKNPLIKQNPTTKNNYQYFPLNDLITANAPFNKRGEDWSAQFSAVFKHVKADSPFRKKMNNLFSNVSITIDDLIIKQNSLTKVMKNTNGILDLSNLGIENYMLDIFKFFDLSAVKELDLSGNKLNFLPDNLFAEVLFANSKISSEENNYINRALRNYFSNLTSLKVDNNLGFSTTQPIFTEEIINQTSFTGEWFKPQTLAVVSFSNSQLNNNSFTPLLDGGGNGFFRALANLDLSKNINLTNEPIIVAGGTLEPQITALLNLWNQKVAVAINSRKLNLSQCGLLSINANDLITNNYTSIISKGFHTLDVSNNDDFKTLVFNNARQAPNKFPTILNLKLANTKVSALDDFSGFFPNNKDDTAHDNPISLINFDLDGVSVSAELQTLPPKQIAFNGDEVEIDFKQLNIPLSLIPAWVYKSGRASNNYFWNSLLTKTNPAGLVMYRAAVDAKPVDISTLMKTAILNALSSFDKTIILDWKVLNQMANDVNLGSNGENVGDSIQIGFHDRGEFIFTFDEGLSQGVDFKLDVITNTLDNIKMLWNLKDNKEFFLLSELGAGFKPLAFKTPDEVLNQELAPELENGTISEVEFGNNILKGMINSAQLKFTDDGFNWNSAFLQLVGSKQVPKISSSTTKPTGISIVPGGSIIDNNLGSLTLKLKIQRETEISFIYSPKIYGFKAPAPIIEVLDVVQILSNLEVLENLPLSGKDDRRSQILTNIQILNNKFSVDNSSLDLTKSFRDNYIYKILDENFTKNLNTQSLLPIDASTPLISFENFASALDFSNVIMKVNFNYLTIENGAEEYSPFSEEIKLVSLDLEAEIKMRSPGESGSIQEDILKIGSKKLANVEMSQGEAFLHTLPSQINKSDFYTYWKAFFSKLNNVSDKTVEVIFDKTNKSFVSDETGAVCFSVNLDIWNEQDYMFERCQFNNNNSNVWQIFKRTPTNIYWNNYDEIRSRLQSKATESSLSETQKAFLNKMIVLTQQTSHQTTAEFLKEISKSLNTFRYTEVDFYIDLLRIFINEELSWRINFTENDLPLISFSASAEDLMRAGKIFITAEIPNYYAADINLSIPESGNLSTKQAIKQEVKIIKGVEEVANAPDVFNTNINTPQLWVDQSFLSNNQLNIDGTYANLKQLVANNISSLLRIPNQYQEDADFWKDFKTINPNLAENITINDAKNGVAIDDATPFEKSREVVAMIGFEYMKDIKLVIGLAVSSPLNISNLLYQNVGNDILITTGVLLGVSALITVALTFWLISNKKKHIKTTKQITKTVVAEKRKVALSLTPEEKLNRVDLVKTNEKVKRVLDFSSNLEKTIFSEKEETKERPLNEKDDF